MTERYNLVQIALHWLTAVLIAAAFVAAWTFGDMPLSPEKFTWINWHKWLGGSVLLLVMARILWRSASRNPAPLPGQPGWQVALAISVHHLLYLLMVAVPVLGWMMSSAKGYPVVLFGKLPLPDLVGRNESLGELLETAHVVAAYVLLAVIVLHVAATLKHVFIDRDGTMQRMLPGRTCQSKEDQA